MKVFGLAGWSGSGKTTLLERLLPELTGAGLRVSTVKHTHHVVDLDQPGKDSYRHRAAGAVEVLVASSARWALLHENREESEAEIEALLRHLTPVDLLLIEGFKRHPHPKIEIHRPVLGKDLLHPDDPTVIAVASDQPLPGCPLPVLPLNDPAAVAAFVLSWFHESLSSHPAAALPAAEGSV